MGAQKHERDGPRVVERNSSFIVYGAVDFAKAGFSADRVRRPGPRVRRAAHDRSRWSMIPCAQGAIGADGRREPARHAPGP